MKYLLLTSFLFIGISARPADLSPILTHYYQLKDALVASDAAAAATAAGEMLKAINGVDMKSMTPADHGAFMALEDKLAFTITATSSYEDAAALAQKWGVPVTDSALKHTSPIMIATLRAFVGGLILTLMLPLLRSRSITRLRWSTSRNATISGRSDRCA